ncbi:hypothetical protein HanIR_Chr09g0392991 [Helianthus annuus]|nr:hypothetical protein HanIR_Chr09g0392991 [Helianthus annuus]
MLVQRRLLAEAEVVQRRRKLFARHSWQGRNMFTFRGIVQNDNFLFNENDSFISRLQL